MVRTHTVRVCVIGPWDLQSTHRERGGRWREGEREREGA